MSKKTFYELSEEEQEKILQAAAQPSEAATWITKDLIELKPSKLIDPDKPLPEDEENIENSPFPWTPETGFIVPEGEDIEYLSNRLDKDQLKSLKKSAKKQFSATGSGLKELCRRPILGGETETISTDSVDDRFDNI
jgi:hypothetical protein